MSTQASPDFEQALTVLRTLRTACSTTIDALDTPPPPAQAALLNPPPACAVLHKDFLSLLTLIYTNTTKAALVLRPTEPAYSAACAPLRELQGAVSALGACAALFAAHGATVAKAAARTARGVCEAVRALAEDFIEGRGEGYLVRTGAVHELVEAARKEMPADNLAAVRARWREDRGMLEDSAADVAAMLEDGAEDDDVFGDEDGGFDELGFGSGKKMNAAEIARAKKIQPLVRFVTLLHKRVLPDVLAPLASATTSEPSALSGALDALPEVSTAVVVAIEELVAALYAPQDLRVLASAVHSLTKAATAIHGSVRTDVLIPLPPQDADLASRLGELKVGEDGQGTAKGGKAAKDVGKWLDTCLAQIDKSARSIEEFLSSESTSPR